MVRNGDVTFPDVFEHAWAYFGRETGQGEVIPDFRRNRDTLLFVYIVCVTWFTAIHPRRGPEWRLLAILATHDMSADHVALSFERLARWSSNDKRRCFVSDS